ncbi:hypothetical protein [Lunatimonas salinarum]|uniref:hypothetical protein n=1 Tax=Lunatimonas salinarum TaxID=1774590 RepID=UPI001AE0C894|nr:hypothetical protein [Lunatimonas salinarum]
MPLALDNLRVGRAYRLVNFGEVRTLKVLEKVSANNFRVKDMDTLEQYELEELLRWGRGSDYDLDEIIE